MLHAQVFVKRRAEYYAALHQRIARQQRKNTAR